MTNVVTDLTEDMIKNHPFTRSLDVELNTLVKERALLTDNNLIQKITKEVSYIEEMKSELKMLKNIDEFGAVGELWSNVKVLKKGQ